ncbi:MAG TPA: NAD(P)-dependent oxidoreductase, partial [Acidimicrobiia bacterium]|nr:NAD(P)-dependent oxidoreductase [Acidimicrobiia bacterium]
MRLIAQFAPDTPQAQSLRAVHPGLELIQYQGGDPPADLRADAFFGGYLGWDDVVQWLDESGARWVQLTGTGVDGVPDAVFDGRTVTCARGASAVPISEWVMAALLSWSKRMPETFLQAPPKYWNFPIPTFDRLDGSTLALIGLGGIGSAIARRATAFGIHVRAMRRTDQPSPVDGVEIVTSLEKLLPGAQHVVLAAP